LLQELCNLRNFFDERDAALAFGATEIPRNAAQRVPFALQINELSAPAAFCTSPVNERSWCALVSEN
jgi:hypothetical protein